MTGLVVALALIAAPRVLVLDFEPVGVDAEVARAVDPLVLRGASEAGVDVVAEAEIKRIADVEATKQDLGCDTSSCLAELAGAMGAELVLFGTVTRLGTTTTVNVSLFDNRSTQIARDAVVTEDVGSLPRELPPRVRELVARAVGGAQASEPVATSGGTSPLLWLGVGGATLGAIAAVGGGVLIGLNEALIQDPSALSQEKRDAQLSGRIGIGVAAAGGFVAAAGVALVIATWGDP